MFVELFYEILQVVQDENPNYSKNFPDRLRGFRIARNLGQAELGKVVGRTASTISDWEKGKTQPSLKDIELLSERLDVTPSRLAFGEVDGSQTTQSSDHPITESTIGKECIGILTDLLNVAGQDQARLGWVREQLLQHLRMPPHWVEDTAGTKEAKRLMANFIKGAEELRNMEAARKNRSATPGA